MVDILKEYIEDFLDYCLDIRNYSQSSVLTYEIALNQMLLRNEFYEENGITILDITPFRIEISKSSKKTISKKLSAVRSLVKYMQDQRDLNIKLIGADSIKTPQSLPKPVEQKYIDEALEKATLEEKLIVTMLYGLGLRISELSSVELSNISTKWVRVEGKGRKTRELPLLGTIKTLIDEYLKTNNPKKYLFEKGNTPLSSAQLRYKITKLFKESGIKVTPHQLRHSFATHLLNNGARISDVSELLGHESMATTQLYTKLDSVKKLNEYKKAHPLMGE